MRLTVESTTEGLHLDVERNDGQKLAFDLAFKGLTFAVNSVIMERNTDGIITLTVPFEEETPA